MNIVLFFLFAQSYAGRILEIPGGLLRGMLDPESGSLLMSQEQQIQNFIPIPQQQVKVSNPSEPGEIGMRFDVARGNKNIDKKNKEDSEDKDPEEDTTDNDTDSTDTADPDEANTNPDDADPSESSSLPEDSDDTVEEFNPDESEEKDGDGDGDDDSDFGPAPLNIDETNFVKELKGAKTPNEIAAKIFFGRHPDLQPKILDMSNKDGVLFSFFFFFFLFSLSLSLCVCLSLSVTLCLLTEVFNLWFFSFLQ